MHLHDQIPVLVLHVLETDIPQDTGIVDEHVYPAESLDGRLDDLVAILDRVVVGDCFAAGGGDLVDDGVGGLDMVMLVVCRSSVSANDTNLRPTTLALERAAEIIDDHIRSPRSEE